MKIVVGKYAGFCPGVKRAWALVSREVLQSRTLLRKAGKSSSVFILGELIHNRQAIAKVEDWGIKTIDKLEEIREKKAVVFIRAHGEPPKTYQKLAQRKGLKVIDATCPSVVRVQKLASQIEKEGYQVFVCGERNHPEARATVAYTRKGKILSSLKETEKVRPTDKIGVVSQTTFSSPTFMQICQALKRKCRNFKSLGTICNFTQAAQKEAREIAQKVDLVIVVGGKQSSNTKRLTEVASETVLTYQIETKDEVQKNWLRGVGKIGLLAGASTPDWIIKEVKKKLSDLGSPALVN